MSDLLSPADIVDLNKVVGETGRLLKPEILESSFASLDYYHDPYEKIASVARSIMQGHPFVDGNKRTGVSFLFVSARIALLPVHSHSSDAIVDFAVRSVIERWSVSKIAQWLQRGA